MKRLLLALCLVSALGICYGGGWGVPGAGPSSVSPEQETQIKELISNLIGIDTSKWESAQKQLLEIGLPARAYAEEALKNPPSGGAKSRLEKLLSQLPDPAASEMLLKATENLDPSNSYRFSSSLNGSVTIKAPSGKSQTVQLPTLKADGYQKEGDVIYTKAYPADPKHGAMKEFYQKDGYVVSRKNGLINWTKQKDKDDDSDSFLSRPGSISKFSEVLDVVRFGKTDRCQGVDCKIIEVPIKGENLAKILPKDTFRDIEDVTGITLFYKLWVGKNDFITYKMMSSVEIEGGFTVSGTKFVMVINLSTDIKIMDYGKENKTPLPEAVRKLLEE